MTTQHRENVLIKHAKAGSTIARDQLFLLYADDIRQCYEFGPDGIRPRNFGYGLNPSGHSYSQSCGKVYQWFTKVINRYDSTIGMSFKSYLLQEITFRSMDMVKVRQNRESMEIQESRLRLTNTRDCDNEYSLFDTLQAAQAAENFEAEQHQRRCENLCDRIEALFPENSNERRYLQLYRELGQAYKNPTTKIAEVMGVSRQAVNLYKKNVQKRIAKLNNELGSHFSMAA